MSKVPHKEIKLKDSFCTLDSGDNVVRCTARRNVQKMNQLNMTKYGNRPFGPPNPCQPSIGLLTLVPHYPSCASTPYTRRKFTEGQLTHRPARLWDQGDNWGAPRKIRRERADSTTNITRAQDQTWVSGAVRQQFSRLHYCAPLKWKTLKALNSG